MHEHHSPTSPLLKTPKARYLEATLRALEPWHRLTSPHWSGLEHIPDERPLLFVGNHSLYAVFDAPVMCVGLYEKLGIVMRPLVDRVHFQMPLWRNFIQNFGFVNGTRAHCAALMETQQAILVFPGGSREASKRRGEQNTLVWGNRMGFARMAMAHQCTIVPFAALGMDDAYRILLDGSDLLRTPVLGSVLRRAGVRSDLLPPIVFGLGPLPYPNRLYFHFGAPIRPDTFGDDPQDDDACWALRKAVEAAVDDGLAAMLQVRASDPSAALRRRLRHILKARYDRPASFFTDLAIDPALNRS
ncbi:MAG: lysophospholipid acyltransferase family protein [Myxococcota bacterium]